MEKGELLHIRTEIINDDRNEQGLDETWLIIVGISVIQSMHFFAASSPLALLHDAFLLEMDGLGVGVNVLGAHARATHGARVHWSRLPRPPPIADRVCFLLSRRRRG